MSAGEYQTANKGEVGFVPVGATKAVVFTPDAVNATFNYTGYTPAAITIGAGSPDLTVPAGATINWTNKTGLQLRASSSTRRGRTRMPPAWAPGRSR